MAEAAPNLDPIFLLLGCAHTAPPANVPLLFNGESFVFLAHFGWLIRLRLLTTSKEFDYRNVLVLCRAAGQ